MSRNDVIKDGSWAESLPSAIFIGTWISTVTVLYSDNARHWAMIPITLGGWIIWAELLRALRARQDWLAPRTVVAIFGVYFFYFVPILHLVLDHWLQNIPPPPDWRAALGVSAWVNVLALSVYIASVSLRARGVRHRLRSSWPRMRVLLLAGISLGVVVWLAVAAQFGGPGGYLTSLADETADLTGYGLVLLFAEAWPFLLLILLLLANRDRLRSRPKLIVLVFLLFLVLQFLTGGLRGSRALIVWPLLIGLTVSHLAVRRIRVRNLLVIIVSVFVFAWLYGFYKSAGTEILDLFGGGISAGDLSEGTGRNMSLLLTEDFGRSGIQALIAHHVFGGARLALGETYLGDIQVFVPDSLVVFPFQAKTDYATELFYGVPADYLDGFLSSRILGLGGEAMVNFGLLGVVVMFAIYGRVVASWNNIYMSALRDESDIRNQILAGVFPAMAILGLISDLDNLILFSLKYVFPIAIVVWLSSESTRRDGRLFSGQGGARVDAD